MGHWTTYSTAAGSPLILYCAGRKLAKARPEKKPKGQPWVLVPAMDRQLVKAESRKGDEQKK